MIQPRHKTFYVDIIGTEGEEIVDESGETIGWSAVKRPITVEDIEEVVDTDQIKNYSAKKEKI